MDVDDPMWEVATACSTYNDYSFNGRKAMRIDPLLERIRRIRAERRLEVVVECMICGADVTLAEYIEHRCTTTRLPAARGVIRSFHVTGSEACGLAAQVGERPPEA